MYLARTSRALFFGEHATQSRGNQHVDGRREQFVIRDRRSAGKSLHRLMLAAKLQQGRHVDPLPVGDAAVLVGDGDNFGPFGMQELRGIRADVPEPLQRDRRPFDVLFDPLQKGRRQRGDAAAGRLFAPLRAVQLQRLARHAGRTETMVFLVLVHEPGHHLGVRSHIGGRDIAVGTDDVVGRVDEFPRDPLEFALAQLVRIDGDSALWLRRTEY